MKKIVSVLSVAALTLSAVFAADITLKYNTKGTLYEETNTKTVKAGSKDDLQQTRSIFDQSGYGDAESDLVISARNDYAGFVLDLTPNATAKDKLTAEDKVSEYYGWMNFGNLQVTVGKWESRYAFSFDGDGGEWDGDDYERYHLGVIGGKYAYDADNLTGVYSLSTTDKVGNSTFFYAADVSQKLGTALAYTVRPAEDTFFMVKGVLVENDWGSTLRGDSDRNYSSYGVGGSDISFFSGFAGEVAFRNSAIDINLIAKSLVRDQLVFGAYVRPILSEKSSFLLGFTYGMDLSDDRNANGDHTLDRKYSEMAFDFRGHFQIDEALCLTTMNNLSVLLPETEKDADNLTDLHLWNMVSLGYQASEQVLAQLTVESEADVLHTYTGADGVETSNVRDLGGFTISVIPGVTYSFNENATLTAGVKFEWAEIGASSDFKSSDHTTTTKVQIPVVFAVEL